MALINCPDCDKQVSSSAPACPHCGAPIASALAGSPPAKQSAPDVQTVEQTSKKYKAQQGIGCVVAMVGLFIFFGATATDNSELGIKAMLGVVLGAVWFLAARAFAWWNHG